jgi:Flp pilus assembly protein TadG
MMKRIKRSRSHQRRGAAVVEFALIAPLMLFFTFGMIEISRMMMVKNAATQATREGARAAVLPYASNQAVLERVQQELGLVSVDSAVIETEPANVATASPGSNILVRVRINPDSVSWVPTFVSFTIPEIVAESTMRKEATN